MARRRMCVPLRSAPTVSRLFWERVEASPEGTAYGVTAEAGGWSMLSWREMGELVRRLASVLRRRGIRRGDTIGVLAPTGLEWELVNLAASSLGAVIVGLDMHARDDYLEACVRNVDLDVIVAQDDEVLARLPAPVVAHAKLSVLLQSDGRSGRPPWQTLLGEGAGARAIDPVSVSPHDTATVVFTSGTTGEPKALHFTHHQLMVSVEALLEAMPPVEEGACQLCWLPMSNLFQRLANLVAVSHGGLTYMLSDPRELLTRAQEVEPHLLLGVPRLYEKIYAGLLEQVGKRARWQRGVVRWALAQGAARVAEERAGESVASLATRARYALAERLVLRGLRRKLWGRNLRFVFSGSAALSPWLGDAFEALGVPMLQGYGVSESATPLTFQRLDARRPGTVGQGMLGHELKVAADGEILVRGPGVARDAHVPVDDEGWLHTGDLGRLGTEGHVTLEGRKSEIVKLSTGRRLVPAPIEGALQKVPLVDQAVVFGAGFKRPVALISLDGETCRSVEEIEPRLREQVAAATAELAAAERPAALAILPRPFSAEHGELTHNLKLRRQAIAERYAETLGELEELVADESAETLPLRWVIEAERKESRDDIAA